jgi:hypothetical protein
VLGLIGVKLREAPREEAWGKEKVGISRGGQRMRDRISGGLARGAAKELGRGAVGKME